MPGLDGVDPEWVARTGELRYAGSYNFTNPVDPTSANFTYPMEVTVALSSELPGVRTVSSYDLGSGVLVGYQTFVASSGTTVQLQLEQMPRAAPVGPLESRPPERE